jgi:two-component sensor histidine kinase
MPVPFPNRVSPGAPGDMGFDLCIDPNPRFVSVVRRFVEAALDRLLADPEAVFRISMSAHELMENAAKYSIGNRTVLRVSYQRADEGARVSLYLSNETTPEHIDRLKVRVQAITDAVDPFVHYQALMRQTARAVDESGLGLARIRAEGEMDLGLEVRGNTVALIADTRLTKESLR